MFCVFLFLIFKNLFLTEEKLLPNVVLVSAIQQRKLATIIHVSSPSGACLPSPHPIPLGHHGVLGWAPWVIQQLLTSRMRGLWGSRRNTAHIFYRSMLLKVHFQWLNIFGQVSFTLVKTTEAFEFSPFFRWGMKSRHDVSIRTFKNLSSPLPEGYRITLIKTGRNLIWSSPIFSSYHEDTETQGNEATCRSHA